MSRVLVPSSENKLNFDSPEAHECQADVKTQK